MTRPPIDQQITFLYTGDLETTAQFYEQVLGLPLARDQGTCRIYRVSEGGYLGICQREGWPKQPAEPAEAPVILTLVTPDVETWYELLSQRGVAFAQAPEWNPRYQITHCFLRDPNGYLIEIQRFREPL